MNQILTPSYKGFKPASLVASGIKKRNRHIDTKPELILRSALWRSGLRFRKNVSALPGKPDIVFLRARVAVFCDGDFWHGRNWRTLKEKLARRANADYWIPKIRANIQRDRRNKKLLENEGWHVVRIWEGDLRNNVQAIVGEIRMIVNTRKHHTNSNTAK